jgi:serine/threonine-protein kinase
MLTGHYAFNGDSLPAIMYHVINETPVPAESLRPQLPAELASLLARMLSKNPEARPDARALVDALHAAVPATPHMVVPPPRRKSRLVPILAVVALIGLFVLIWSIAPFAPPAPQKTPPPMASPGRPTPPAQQPAARAEADSQASTTDAKPVQPVPVPSPPVEPDAYLAGLDKKQVELRIKRTELLLQYTKQHPDVKEVDRQLEQLRIERRNYLRQLQKKQ